MTAEYGCMGSIESRAYEYAALLYAIGYFFVLGFAWMVKYGYVAGAIPTELESCAHYASICAMVEMLGGDEGGRSNGIANAVFVFLAVTNLRIILASMLCHSTTSPLWRAVSGNGDRPLGRLVLLYALIKLIALTSLWRAYLLGIGEPWLLPVGLFIESLLVLIFDVIFFKEMKAIGQYKLILALDVAVFLLALFWLGVVSFPAPSPSAERATYFLMFFGAIVFPLAILALVEFNAYLTQFWKSVQSLRKELIESRP